MQSFLKHIIIRYYIWLQNVYFVTYLYIRIILVQLYKRTAFHHQKLETNQIPKRWMRNCDIFAQLFSAKKGIKYSWKYYDDWKKPGTNEHIRINTDDSTYVR